MSNRFVAAAKEQQDERLKQHTVGLVKLQDFQRIRNEINQSDLDANNPVVKKKSKKTATKSNKLSFDHDDEEDADEADIVFKKQRKNPMVDTSFLPDKARLEEEQLIRERLAEKWLGEQEVIKTQKVTVHCSFWDGSSHRKKVVIEKGKSIADFLFHCKSEWLEIRGLSIDALVFVKDDIIIPHNYTFYDFVVNNIMGKSGPLFLFPEDDVLHTTDTQDKAMKVAALSNTAPQQIEEVFLKGESDEAAFIKVCEVKWYETNRHIFPASKWEVFDPLKDYTASELEY